MADLKRKVLIRKPYYVVNNIDYEQILLLLLSVLRAEFVQNITSHIDIVSSNS